MQNIRVVDNGVNTHLEKCARTKQFNKLSSFQWQSENHSKATNHMEIPKTYGDVALARLVARLVAYDDRHL